MDPPEFTTGEFVRFWLAERSSSRVSTRRNPFEAQKTGAASSGGSGFGVGVSDPVS